MLYTTKEIAEMYRVSSYKVTQDWCKKGLKHTYDFKFKKEWVDEFLEETAIQEVFNKDTKFKNKMRPLKKNKNFRPITIEDLEVN